jgi:hypothetical protein
MSNYHPFLGMSQTYTYLWGKYRPVILKLMLSSTEGPQQYELSPHEVKRANPKQKGGYSFTLITHKSRAVNNIRTSTIAKDLLRVLQESKKASELAALSTYEFKLDKHFIFHVTKVDEAPLVVPEVTAEEIA